MLMAGRRLRPPSHFGRDLIYLLCFPNLTPSTSEVYPYFMLSLPYAHHGARFAVRGSGILTDIPQNLAPSTSGAYIWPVNQRTLYFNHYSACRALAVAVSPGYPVSCPRRMPTTCIPRPPDPKKPGVPWISRLASSTNDTVNEHIEQA